MNASTDRQDVLHAAEIAAAAVAFQYGLGRLLAHAVEAATRIEDRALVPQQRREGEPVDR